MIKWEYLHRQLDNIDITKQLNDLGKEGWELIIVNESHNVTICYFKRPAE